MLFSSSLILTTSSCSKQTITENSWIRINQLGYLPQDHKTVVLVSKHNLHIEQFRLKNDSDGKVVFGSDKVKYTGAYGPFASSYRLDFSAFRQNGRFRVEAAGVQSPSFTISADIYAGVPDFLLRYMRLQRCGFNPFLRDSCHTHDGYTIYGPMPDSTQIDVTGGWHDAADYLQYVTTSANAVYNLLLAWRDYPLVFKDGHKANGLPGGNGQADVGDEARWGLQWLLKMHPRNDWMFNQIADDRDHAGFRLPTKDSVDYGKGFERPVYFNSGQPQGIFEYQNHTEGTASTAGKIASAMALGAKIFANRDAEFASKLSKRARSAFNFGLAAPGNTQTAPCKAPYFYEENNWTDDMELGAAALFALTGDEFYGDYAEQYSQMEPVTPWMGADTARHYQWYPFINIGHYELARHSTGVVRDTLIKYYRRGIERVWQRGQNNAFFMGVPFIWCSNNLVATMATQCYLYRKLSGDESYRPMEMAMRDWLLGCNPWGTSMIIGLPQDGVYPRDPHSAFSHLYDYPQDGGLIDGPVYTSIFNRLKGVHLSEADEFAQFQSTLAVYHDDVSDYSTNEPTMDGTATLMYYMAAMANAGRYQQDGNRTYGENTRSHGALIRGSQNKKQFALIFSGDRYADGGQHIRQVLKKHKVQASFFLTGRFYRDSKHAQLIRTLRNDGHYLGAHSDQHVLYCDWEKRDSLLVDQETFLKDLQANYQAMSRFGLDRSDAPYFLPPYEWYNHTISRWTTRVGLQLINFTPGTLSQADYTTPGMGPNYRDSQTIIESILQQDNANTNGLNGYLLLMHLGTHPDRQDKLYKHLDRLIRQLQNRGYQLTRVDDLLGK
ncbi:MAG: polysaccharide deacetylase family protein [Caldithrix sp.]|nr:polysaccharide deacetylase family protein [Caldithrix sp.]